MAEDITDTWLGAVVPAWPAGAIRTTRIGAERGIGGVVLRVEAPTGRTVIVKLPIAGQPRSHAVMAREARAYLAVSPTPGIAIPTVHHVAVDDDSSVIVLEDLGHLRAGDDVAGCELDDARIAVAELARFHGSWADNPALDTLIADGVVVPFGDWFTELADRALAAVPAGRTEAGRIAGGEGDRVVATLPRRIDDVMGLARSPVTLVHRDYRLDNMFFDGDRVVLVDWSGLSAGRGALDLGGFLGRCLAGVPTDDEIDGLLATYRQACDSNAPDDLDDDVRRAGWYWLAWAIIVLTTMELAPGPTAVVETWIRRLTPFLSPTV